MLPVTPPRSRLQQDSPTSSLPSYVTFGRPYPSVQEIMSSITLRPRYRKRWSATEVSQPRSFHRRTRIYAYGVFCRYLAGKEAVGQATETKSQHDKGKYWQIFISEGECPSMLSVPAWKVLNRTCPSVARLPGMYNSFPSMFRTA